MHGQRGTRRRVHRDGGAERVQGAVLGLRVDLAGKPSVDEQGAQSRGRLPAHHREPAPPRCRGASRDHVWIRPGRRWNLSADRSFLDEACVDVATVSMVVPMPGTPTFRRLNADSRILTTDWSRYDGKKHCVFEPALMSPAELEAGTEWVARRFYSPKSIVRRLGGSRVGVWWNLPRNLGYMLAGLSTRDRGGIQFRASTYR